MSEISSEVGKYLSAKMQFGEAIATMGWGVLGGLCIAALGDTIYRRRRLNWMTVLGLTLAVLCMGANIAFRIMAHSM